MTLTGDFVTGQTVSFQRMRALMAETALQEGVVGATDFQVIQRAAGANMSVDVGAGAAWIQIDTGTRNGLAHAYNDAAANVVVAASNGTNPRIDQIVLRYNDASIPTGSGNIPTLETLTGTATSGATLDNRTGAASLPSDCLRLADILVPTSSSSVTTANIRDRRPWARGAFFTGTLTAGNVSVSGTTYASGGTLVNSQARIECSGTLLRVTCRGRINTPSTTGAFLLMAPWLDAVAVVQDVQGVASPTAAVGDYGGVWGWDVPVTPGSHTIGLAARVTAGAGGAILATAGIPFAFSYEEIVRPNTSNT